MPIKLLGDKRLNGFDNIINNLNQNIKGVAFRSESFGEQISLHSNKESFYFDRQKFLGDEIEGLTGLLDSIDDAGLIKEIQQKKKNIRL